MNCNLMLQKSINEKFQGYNAWIHEVPGSEDIIELVKKESNIPDVPPVPVSDLLFNLELGAITIDQAVSWLTDSLQYAVNYALDLQQFNGVDIGTYLPWDEIKDSVAVRLVNRDKRSILMDQSISEEFLDLLAIPYAKIPNDLFGKNAYAMIPKGYSVPEQDVLEQAKKNTAEKGFSFMSIFKRMAEVCGSDYDEKRDPKELFVLTNPDSHYGSSELIFPDVLKKVSDDFKSDLFILPSSIHEVLIRPIKIGESIDIDYLRDTVQTINGSGAVEEYDILSDNIYYYDRDTGKLSISK